MKRLWIAPLAFVAIMLGGVGIGQATGAWVASGQQKVVVAKQLTPDALKGWMTLQQAADGLGMSVDDLIVLIDPTRTAGLKPGTAFKDIEALVPGFELSALRVRLGGTASEPTKATSAAPSATASAGG